MDAFLFVDHSLRHQETELQICLEKLGGNAEMCVADPKLVLPPRKYPADIAATTILWIDEAIRAGAIDDAPEARRQWMDEVGQFGDVIRLRDEATGDEGLNMLRQANSLLAQCCGNGNDPWVRWAMAFKKEVDVFGFLRNIEAHGRDHLAKVEMTLLAVEKGVPLVADADD